MCVCVCVSVCVCVCVCVCLFVCVIYGDMKIHINLREQINRNLCFYCIFHVVLWSCILEFI